ncbi:M56 family metallopeptidase [Tenacibaculum agarivorans]|uniref:M56 family metallopeptidase n=1 Tax=Tenacibaculum agarivorans TaxID=1908389 RepID=UPI00094B90B9|nr:M56 family metallopeptidase [Tenacibaculum agarivorans]
MLPYIIQVILFQILFLAIYDLFLSRETFFSKNRFYLLFTSIVSFIIPLIKLTTVQNAIPVKYGVLLPEVVLSPETIIKGQEWYQSIDYFGIIFWLGVFFFSILFMIKLYTILQLIYKSPIEKKKTYSIVLLPKNSKAFSFFNFIFLGENIEDKRRQKVIEHELVHCKEKHTIDLLLFELLKILMWFNPMVWLYQKRISLVHEFISDEIVSKSSEKNKYINNLLAEAFQVEQISFVNQFYTHSFIKKRITMIIKNRSKQIKQVKYLVLIPVLASMLLYTACSNNQSSKEDEKETKSFAEMEKEKLAPPPPLSKEMLNKIKELTGKESVSEEEVREFLKKMRDENAKLSLEKGIVPFSELDKAPAFIGKGEGKEAFNKNIIEFVQKNFNADLVNSLGLTSGKKRIYVRFKIDKKGNIVDVETRAPHPKIEEEAIRMVKKISKLHPGEYQGKPVTVSYVLPITFEVK